MAKLSENSFLKAGMIDGKLPPSAVEIEAAVLGEMIIDSGCLETAVNLLSAEMFYSEEHRLIFSAVSELYAESKSIDALTVAQQLKKNGSLEQAGGAYGVSKLGASVGSGAHVEYHCKIILQKYLMRQLVEAGGEIQKTGFDESLDVSDALAKSEKLITGITDIAEGRRSVKSFTEIVDASLNEAYRRAAAAKEGKMSGITTGLRDLDAKLFGWEQSNLIILAGRPGQGKSALMLHFAKAAARAGVPAAIFSLEMSDVRLTDRLLLSFCDVPAYKFRSGYISRDELCGLDSAAGQLKQLPITIDQTPTVTISQIRAKARAMSRTGRCGMVFIDYLQLIQMSASQGKNVNNAIAEITREAKILAKEINVPVMLLSQLNREVERRADKRPQLADLRDSGAIEQDADIVIFVYRPAYYGIESTDLSGKNSGILTVAKFREGAVGDVSFSHNDGLTQIYDHGTQQDKMLLREMQADLPF
ncbi:MAG: replicative DNA helicase [Prevotellaceae bacterium]|jgi:replicative DNA helicase|nr:replicative DNA helicase [Prevotellaceae bacterium]